jgi:hypothetical protein
MYPDQRHEAVNKAEAAGNVGLAPRSGSSYPPYPGKHEEALDRKLPVLTQEKALAELHNLITELADRMQAVLLPDPEEGLAKENIATTDAPPTSELNRQLKYNNSQIARAANRIHSIINRLDV